MAEPTLVVRRSGDRAEVVLNRPRAHNALNLEMCLELQEAFTAIDRDDSVRVTLVRAAGPTFCAGADLKERRDKDNGWVRSRRLAAFAAYEAIERCRTPVIAVVGGALVGSGGEIAMACDFVVAGTGASFRFPEPHWGTVGATQRLQRVVGKRLAKELLYTGRVMHADEAHRTGLITRLVADDALDAAADEIVAAITSAPALAIALTKQAIDLGSETDLDRGIRIELAAIEHCLADGAWRDTFGDPAADGGGRP